MDIISSFLSECADLGADLYAYSGHELVTIKDQAIEQLSANRTKIEIRVQDGFFIDYNGVELLDDTSSHMLLTMRFSSKQIQNDEIDSEITNTKKLRTFGDCYPDDRIVKLFNKMSKVLFLLTGKTTGPECETESRRPFFTSTMISNSNIVACREALLYSFKDHFVFMMEVPYKQDSILDECVNCLLSMLIDGLYSIYGEDFTIMSVDDYLLVHWLHQMLSEEGVAPVALTTSSGAPKAKALVLNTVYKDSLLEDLPEPEDDRFRPKFSRDVRNHFNSYVVYAAI